MTREQVIKGLECCLEHEKCNPWTYCANSCQYGVLNGGNGKCFAGLMEDALTLLEEQEPRVLTLDEVLDLKFDDVVYVEVVPTHAVLSAIVIEVIPKVPDIDIGVVQFRYAPTWNGINNADLTYYGKTWRCWTSRPTDEQRKAVKWDEPTKEEYDALQADTKTTMQ